MKNMISFLLLLLNSLGFAQINEFQGISVSEEYPQYWQYEAKPALLLGGSNEDNLFQMPNVREHLDLLQSVGGNYVRCTMSSRDEGNEWPFYLDGTKGKYDLNRWNQKYWERFSNFLRWCSERKIIVQIEIWATFDFYRDNWGVNPFNPKNNTNYNADRVDLPLEVPTHPIYTENPFFESVPSKRHLTKLLEYQQKFVDKILSYTFNYNNVLYCMDNETSVSSEWGKFWASYIQQKAKEEGKKVWCTEMWDPWDLNHISHRETFDHPELYGFVEISQNNHQKGEAHWENGLLQIQRLKKKGFLRPVTNVKIYGADGGRHGGGNQDGIEKFIRGVLFGASSVRFHRPSSGIGLSKDAQQVIRSIRDLTNQVPFFDMQPHNDLLMDRTENEAYCRALPTSDYLIYFPKGGAVNIHLDGNVQVRWLNILHSKWEEVKEINSDGTLSLQCPSENHWAVLIKRK